MTEQMEPLHQYHTEVDAVEEAVATMAVEGMVDRSPTKGRFSNWNKLSMILHPREYLSKWTHRDLLSAKLPIREDLLWVVELIK